jgi:iron complex transport system substrate-binding protein
MHPHSPVLPSRVAQRLIAFIVALFSLQLAIADQTPFPVTVIDSRLKLIEIPSPPQSIVSLAPSLTEIAFAVGAGSVVTGVTTYCNFPEEVAGIAKIGGFSAKTISIEAIVSLEPDFVLADLSRHGALIETLEGLGIRVIATNAMSIEDCYAVIEMVGTASGYQRSTGALVESMQTRISRITAITRGIPEGQKPRVFWEVFDEPLMTAGPATFIGQLVDLAGGINIFADVSESWPKISHEELLIRDPEVLMSSESHGEKFTEEQVRARTGWGALSAVEDGRIYLFNGDIVSRPGPRIVDALEAIAVTLYPELFR